MRVINAPTFLRAYPWMPTKHTQVQVLKRRGMGKKGPGAVWAPSLATSASRVVARPSWVFNRSLAALLLAFAKSEPYFDWVQYLKYCSPCCVYSEKRPQWCANDAAREYPQFERNEPSTEVAAGEDWPDFLLDDIWNIVTCSFQFSAVTQPRVRCSTPCSSPQNALLTAVG